MMEIAASEKSVREVNQAIREAASRGEKSITVREPQARHNLGVGLTEPVSVRFVGSVGYYCGGLGDKSRITVDGSAGWGVGESRLGGEVVVRGGAGNGAGASMQGGTLVIRGSAGARAGVSMQGGLLVIGGDCGYMTGFMAQGGTIIVCGDSGENLAAAIGEAQLFVGGEIAGLGEGAATSEPSAQELSMLASTCSTRKVAPRGAWKKVTAKRF